MGLAPGNCAGCIDYHRKNARILDYTGTPCRRCPKFKLYPENYGLHPANDLAVDLYYKAAGDVRVGTMDGAHLLRTLSIQDVQVVLDEFDDEFPTDLHRQNVFEKILLIDHVARSVRAKDEEQQRKSQRAAARGGKA